MTITLTFNLDDPDDRMAHLRALKSINMAIVLFEITYNVRKRTRDGSAEDVFSAIDELLCDQRISIDELVE